jgi:F-type H+-transporting ATPase subunit gamma
MPSLQNIKRRIKSVQSTAQLTKAMQMVASMRFRTNQVLASRSHKYRQSLVNLYQKLEVKEVTSNLQHFFESNKIANKTLMVIVSTQRGLCGGLHRASVISAYNWLESKEIDHNNPNQVEIITVNTPGFKQVSNYGGHLRAGFNDFKRQLISEEVLSISELVYDLFSQRGFKEVRLAYISSLTGKAVVEQILPLIPTPSTHEDATLIDSDVERLSLELVHQYLHSVVYDAMSQTMAAEEKGRMIAMNQASENAKKLTQNLKLNYFKQRQANITQEMSEIIGGA